jgi:hypothetical protein
MSVRGGKIHDMNSGVGATKHGIRGQKPKGNLPIDLLYGQNDQFICQDKCYSDQQTYYHQQESNLKPANL